MTYSILRLWHKQKSIKFKKYLSREDKLLSELEKRIYVSTKSSRETIFCRRIQNVVVSNLKPKRLFFFNNVEISIDKHVALGSISSNKSSITSKFKSTSNYLDSDSQGFQRLSAIRTTKILLQTQRNHFCNGTESGFLFQMGEELKFVWHDTFKRWKIK